MTAAHDIVADLLMLPGTVELRLGPLTEGSAALLLERTLGVPVPADFAAASHRATGGNPFLLVEVAREARIHGSSLPQTALDEVAPRPVVRTIAARLRRLPEPAQALAQAVAVFGRGATFRHAASLANLTEQAAASAADALFEAGIVDGVDPLHYEHAVVRAAVLAGVSPAALALQHRRAAELLASDGADPHQIAVHLLAAPAGNDDWAVAALCAAADDAVRNAAATHAVVYLERALTENSQPTRLWWLHHRLGRAQVLTTDPRAVASLERALADCPASERPAVALDLGDALARSGRASEGFEVVREVADGGGDYARDQLLMLEAAMLTFSQTDNALLPRVRARVDRLENLECDTRSARAVVAIAAYVRATDGSPRAKVLELADRVLPVGGAPGDLNARAGLSSQLRVELLAYGLLGRGLTTFGEIAKARAIRQRMFATATETGSVEMHVLGLVSEAAFAYTTGDVAGAAENAAVAAERALEYGLPVGVRLAAGMQAAAAIETGEGQAVLAHLKGAGLLGPLPEMGVFDLMLYFRGQLRAQHGEFAAGLADLYELGRRERAVGYRYPFTPWRLGAASLLIGAGRAEEACELVDDEVKVARARDLPWLLGQSLRLKAAIEGGEAGIARLLEAEDVLGPSPFRLEFARVKADLGAALRRANHRAEARSHLEIALDLAVRCGATVLADRTREELATAGARPRRVFVTGPESLTATERRVARLTANGLSNPEIAQALFVSRKTVETHLGRIYQKLGINSRGDVAAAIANFDL